MHISKAGLIILELDLLVIQNLNSDQYEITIHLLVYHLNYYVTVRPVYDTE